MTAEVYTFLQPKDYAYYLDYTDATVVDRRRGHARPRCARRRPRAASRRRCSSSTLTTSRCARVRCPLMRSSRASPRISLAAPGCRTATSRSGSSPPAAPAGRRRASTRLASPLCQLRRLRAWRARHPRGRHRASRAKALLRLRARPRGALPVRCRRDRGDLRRADHPRAALRADRAATGRPSSSTSRR